jgi:tRNA modification GTPase
MISSEKDTIAAIATPIGEGGISVIRVSGSGAFAIVDRCFKGKKRLTDSPSHTIHYGTIVGSDGFVLDNVLAMVYKSPRSYTGENTVEVSCHGGIFVTKRILTEILSRGARLAEAGEFSKRAFLNGKIDLSQAEAIADLIQSQTELSHRASVTQLHGKLSVEIESLRNSLIETMGLLELELDFVEDGYAFVDRSKVKNQINSAIQIVEELMRSYGQGKIYREGVSVVLAGAPNVGKSSILNRLLNENRAIVTDIPGTTRDTIEESLNIGGILFKVIDTAGLRETGDIVELEGVARTKQKIAESDILMVVLDASRQMESWEKESLISVIQKKENVSTRCIFVVNKVDLNPKTNGFLSPEITRDNPVVKTSALTGVGLDELKKEMIRQALSGNQHSPDGSAVVTNTRHFHALKSAHASLLLALNSINEGASNEFAAVDIRASLDSLGEITGAVTTDEILNSIFSRFCIGK